MVITDYIFALIIFIVPLSLTIIAIMYFHNTKRKNIFESAYKEIMLANSNDLEKKPLVIDNLEQFSVTSRSESELSKPDAINEPNISYKILGEDIRSLKEDLTSQNISPSIVNSLQRIMTILEFLINKSTQTNTQLQNRNKALTMSSKETLKVYNRIIVDENMKWRDLSLIFSCIGFIIIWLSLIIFKIWYNDYLIFLPSVIPSTIAILFFNQYKRSQTNTKILSEKLLAIEQIDKITSSTMKNQVRKEVIDKLFNNNV